MEKSEDRRNAPNFLSERRSLTHSSFRPMKTASPARTKTMKTKSIATIIAALALLPVAAFAQSPPNPPPPPGQPGQPPPGPGERDHHEKKVPVTYLGVETSDVPRVVSE